MHNSIVKWICCIPFLTFGQNVSNYQVDLFTFHKDSLPHSLQLSRLFIIPSTLRVRIDSVLTESFSYDRSTRSVILSAPMTEPYHDVSISYHYIPMTLQSPYQNRSLVIRYDSSSKELSQIVVAKNEGIFSNMFGPELSKSGSISRGFFVGTNRDFTVNSGFRLQLMGKLSDEIEIVAALSDENTPIQPQGNTQTLQEIDNVFVEIKSPTYTATVGDFYYANTAGEFSKVNRKLQGAQLNADYRSMDPHSQFTMIGATARGKFHTNQFSGIEGSQGPYRLYGKNNDRNIIVIAGSEKVFIDGEPMTRGDNNDYSIDYGSAEITFSTRRLITGASRIVVDFEYSDRQFTRNAVGVNTSTMFGSSLILRINYFREGDDPDAPIDIVFSDSDKDIVRQSGNSLALKNGISAVGVDSLGIGKGNYAAIDTVINGASFTYYRYEVGTPLSLYAISFSNLGQGNGDYIRESIGKYTFVGKKAGQFAPVIILPAPQLQQNFSFQSVYSIGKEFEMSGEYSASNFDQNRISPLNDDRNSGQAYRFQLSYRPTEINVFGTNIGSLDVSLSERFVDGRYTYLDRVNEVEFGRKWSTDSISISPNTSEEIREAAVIYNPVTFVTVRSGLGSLTKGNQYASSRYDAGFDFGGTQLPKANYRVEYISGDENIAKVGNIWFRQKGSAEYSFQNITASFKAEQEDRTIRNVTSDSLLASSFSFFSYSPRISGVALSIVEASTEFEWRNDEAPLGGVMTPQSNSFTQNYGLGVRETNNFSFSSLVTLRDKTYNRFFQSTNTNQQTTLLKLQSRYRPYSQGIDVDLLYDVATQRTATLERVFFKVRKGEGQYRWIDANNNGIIDVNDEKEFRLDRYEGEYIALILNSDILRPIINLKTSARIRISPSRIIQQPNTFFEKCIAALSTETYIRIEERSSEPNIKKIYLLDQRSLLNPTTTIYGVQFLQQDLFLFENSPISSFRFRYNQRNALSQYSSGLERNYSRERSIRSRVRVSTDISNETEVMYRNDNAVSSSLLNQTRQITSMVLSTDLTYRPAINSELGIKLETGQAEDKPFLLPVISDFNAQTLRYVYGFQGNGQIRAEIAREEIRLSNNPVGYTIPYELTGGRDSGQNFLWSIGSDYRFGGNIQFSLQYYGRTTSNKTVVHNGKMEVRAYF